MLLCRLHARGINPAASFDLISSSIWLGDLLISKYLFSSFMTTCVLVFFSNSQSTYLLFVFRMIIEYNVFHNILYSRIFPTVTLKMQVNKPFINLFWRAIHCWVYYKGVVFTFLSSGMRYYICFIYEGKDKMKNFISCIILTIKKSICESRIEARFCSSRK